MKKTAITIFKYLEPLWTGADGKISSKAVAVILLIWKLVTTMDWGVQKWDANRSLGDLSAIGWIYAAIIGGIWGLGIYNNTKMKEIEARVTNPTPSNITVEKAETVTNQPATRVETVNAENVETVNTQTTNIERSGD